MTAIRHVVLVGLFSANERDHQARLDTLEQRVAQLGGHVVQRHVQRRGVSDGGVHVMASPLSRRYLVGSGKLEEIATTCVDTDVDAVVFINDLSDHQRRSVSTRLQRPVLTAADLDPPAQSLTEALQLHRPASQTRREIRRRR
ncbi:hypothetical protein [Asanoa iriomotensis]|uniref:HflX-like GTP-binding protein n=1 Tax=Asanoa iriomotensis TaxID=234613 RepID=UPI001945477A|nr:hypothetical protein [Asanoa iriomotensis]